MADPKSFLPYPDPYEGPEDILNLMDFRNPTLEDLKIQEPLSSHSSIPQPNDAFGDPTDPFDDPAIWKLPGDPNAMSSQAGPSDIPGGETSNRSEENWTTDDSRPISDWPSQPIPFTCSCCQVLREIIHSNGNEITKLEIHGRLGIICHAILDVHAPSILNSVSAGHHYRMFDFCKKSNEGVKQFLIQYCLERKQAGFLMIPDPLWMFYEALCVGFFWDEGLNIYDEFMQPSTSNAETFQADQPEVAHGKEQDRVSTKTYLAAQRERTGKLTIKDIGDYFHLPIEEAAKRIRLCPTVVKKICRRGGLNRWPHRKIKAIERQISNWTAALSSNDPNEVARAQTEIQRLREELAKIHQTVVNSL